MIARAVITADEAGPRWLRLGYSDDVQLFLNGRPVFSGVNRFRSRHPSFLGLAKSQDAVLLDLREGDNELVVALSELFGGWGVVALLEDAD